MNEELIKQVARDGYAELCRKEGWPSLADAATRGEEDDADEVVCAIAAIRLYHARHVAPLEQKNAELRALMRKQIDRARTDGERIGRLQVKVAPLVEAVTKVCATWSFYGDTTLMAQLRTAVAPFQQGAALSALAETDGPHVGEARDAAD